MQTSSPTAARTGTSPPHIVLVPGFWLGAWAWDEVLPHLRDQGLDAVALTLPGLSPDSDETARAAVRLEDHVGAVEAAIDAAPDGTPVVLVAHSGAAIPVTAALDRHVDRVGHVVWVDTAPVADGYAMAPEVEGAEYPLSAQWDEEYEQGSMAGLDEQQLARFRERAVPQPTSTMREPVRLSDERRRGVPMTLVATAFTGADYRSYAEQGVPFLVGLLEYARLELVDLPTGHWPMWSRPAELAGIIADRALALADAD